MFSPFFSEENHFEGARQCAVGGSMLTKWNNPDFCMSSELVAPVSIKASGGNTVFLEGLLQPREPSLSFATAMTAELNWRGAYVVLDFGKEICGGLRILTQYANNGKVTLHITLGESLTEACSSVGEKNATNDHSPRDFSVSVSGLADLTLGQSGFRFARIEVADDSAVGFRGIFAVNNVPYFPQEGWLTTDDDQLNEIIRTAAYTLKLCFQNGYIWDGIKRDRLVWCGDMNPEIVTAMYLFGDNQNITNALQFLRNETPAGEWINDIPTYTAWWILNLCDYCAMSGNTAFFDANKDYAHASLQRMNACVDAEGNMEFGELTSKLNFFLDWPTFGTDDAVIGTASLIVYTAKTFLQLEESPAARDLIRKLQPYLFRPCTHKCIRAFQILAGRKMEGDAQFLEADGAKDLSTFMAYYILKADAMAGGKNMISILKAYYGGMLSRGATTFWEDFDLDCLADSGRIDEFPGEGERDIHGDYGAFCYQGLRHSLCHGWSAGVLAFLYEYLLGVDLRMGLDTQNTPGFWEHSEICARIPVAEGQLCMRVRNGKVCERTLEK